MVTLLNISVTGHLKNRKREKKLNETADTKVMKIANEQ